MTTAEVERIQDDGLVLVGQAEDVEIVDDASFQATGLFARQIAAYLKRVHEFMDPICEATHQAHKTATGQRARLLEAAETAKRIVDTALAAWEQSERDRVARELAAAEAERLAAEQAQEQAVEQKVEALIEAGNLDEAQALIDAPPPAPVVFTPPVKGVAKVEGVSFRTTWEAEVKDLKALLKAVLAGTAPINAVEPNMKVLHGLARSLQKHMNIPGVEAKEKRSSAVRA